MAQEPVIIRNGVAVMDPNTSTAGVPNTLKINSDGSINVTASGGGEAITMASGAVASGAYSAGSIATGALVDGADVTQGVKADATAALPLTSNSVISLLKALAAAALSTDPVQTYQSNSYARITTNATTVVKNAAGTFVGFIVNSTGTTETVTVYDNTAASGTNPFTFVLTGLAVGAMVGPPQGVAFGTGITVVTSGSSACDITVMYR